MKESLVISLKHSLSINNVLWVNDMKHNLLSIS